MDIKQPIGLREKFNIFLGVFIFIVLILPFRAYSQAGTDMSNPIELGFFTSHLGEELLEGQLIQNYGNHYGGAEPEVFYRFTVTGNVAFSVALGNITQNHIYILDTAGATIISQSYNSEWTMLNFNLAPGTYYLVIEGVANSANGGELSINAFFDVLDDSGVSTPSEGVDIANAFFIGKYNGDPIDYTDIRSNAPPLAYGNHYGNASHDVFYKFTVDGKTSLSLSTCDSRFHENMLLYLLDSGGNLLESNNGSGSPCSNAFLETVVESGTYYIVVESNSSSAYSGGNFKLQVTGTVKASEGVDRDNAILIGNYTLGGLYTYHDYRSNVSSNGYGNDIGELSDDIYYKLIIGNTAKVDVSLCGSDFDTYLYLLNSNGVIVQSNDNDGPLCPGLQSSLSVANLPSGTYYIVAEGKDQNSGNISLFVETEMQGNPEPVISLLPIHVSSAENYVLTKTILVDSITSESQLAGLARDNFRANVQYFDGLGRPIQEIAISASPDGRDIVKPISYDDFGRADKEYLSYAALVNSSSPAGSLRKDALASEYTSSAQFQFYQQDQTSIPKIPNPYALHVLESSPINRILETGLPGRSWAIELEHTVKHDYQVNTANEVKLWKVTSSSGLYTGASTNEQYYPAGQLYKNVKIDENGSKVIEFSDKDGNLLCKKVQDGGSETNPTFTTMDYVYDIYGNLTYVIPPALENLTSFTKTSTEFLNYIYAYHYDGRSRLIEKKVPGEDWIYMVYNSADWLILFQDASQRQRTGGAVWSFTKYDRLGRPIITGEILSSQSRAVLQNNVSSSMKPTGSLLLHESRNNAQYFGYTTASYPNHTNPDVEVFTVTYYDRYDFLNVPVISGKSQISRFRPPSGTATESTVTIGLVTASLSRVLGTNDFLLSETMYDNKGRVSNVIVEHHMNGVDERTNDYNFIGELLTTNRKHYKNDVLAVTIKNQHTYDHVGRVAHSSEQINQQVPAVTKYSYNALGQLEVKRMGNKSIVHSYNPRGWLSKASSSLFNYSLYYDFPSNRSNAQFNGTISEVVWTTGINRTAHRYAYSYDRLNRLLSGVSDENYGESLTYDKMGNINSLVRTGIPSIAGASGTFAYDYDNAGNQLQSFTNGSNYSRNFQYNSKGNVVADGQIKIAYNELNLPMQVKDYNNTIKVDYLYDVQGRKLRKQSPQETRDYVNGIEYVESGTSSTIDFLHMEEGIARHIGGTYHYEYFLKDHLGNTRVVYNDGSAVLQQTDYYPFGMEINRKISSPRVQYTYNGKEFQEELNQFDYGARFYDPVVGRWSVVDPLAEMFRGWSPYNYTMSNPINFIDPDGRIPYPITIRSFAPFKTFGYGFHGDNRGYTTSTATARVHQVINFDTDKSKISAKAWSSSTSHRFLPSSRTATPSVEFTDVFKTRTSGDAKAFMFGTHYKGGNPMTPKAITPDIDVFSNFSITENKKAGTLNISGTLTGDNFPSTEAFISDPSGQNVFLGIGQIGAGVDKDKGPMDELPGENRNRPVTNFNFSITTDRKGNFTGVRMGDTNYSIEDWNKRFTSQPTQQQ